LGGLNDGLVRVMYQVVTDDEVAMPDSPPTARQMTTDMDILTMARLLLCIMV